MDYFIILLLLILSAFFSGLTLGYFSLNRADLKRKAKLGNKDAIKVYELRRQGNLLLSTLLIGNVAVNSTLSIFLGSLAGGFLAGFIATGLIVVFGEIVPQAVFSRHALKVGAKFYYFTKICKFLFYPITYPISFALDKVLGKELPAIYSKKELMKIIEEHEDHPNSDVDEDEERIIKGALSFSQKKVRDIMTPKDEIFALAGDHIFNEEILNKINEFGHSRIPVYKKSKDNIVGILFVKDILKSNFNHRLIEDICRKKVIKVNFEKTLDDVLNDFKKQRNHLFLAVDNFGKTVGIITIEDILEEIIGADIMDEHDDDDDLKWKEDLI